MADSIQFGSAERRTETLAPTIYGLVIPFFILSTISVFLRLYSRKSLLHHVGADDIAICIAQLLSFGVTITTIFQTAKGGLGKHIEFVTKDEFNAGVRGLMSNTLVYNAAQIVTKVSFLIQYRRLFPSTTIQYICNFGLVFLGIWGVTQEFLTGFACYPATFINPSLVGRCISTNVVFNLNAAMNIATDFAIFLIPIWPVTHLHLPKKRKIHLLAVFLLGFFACAVSIIRLYLVVTNGNTQDLSWVSAGISYWSAIELNVGILCACLPTLRPLIRKFFPNLLGSSQGTNTANYKLGTISSRRTRTEVDKEMGIYIQKDVEFQSTTELRSKNEAKHPGSSRGESIDVIVNEVSVKSDSARPA